MGGGVEMGWWMLTTKIEQLEFGDRIEKTVIRLGCIVVQLVKSLGGKKEIQRMERR